MISPTELQRFTPAQIAVINDAAAMAEELVSNAYKMSASQWLRRKYDFKTVADLDPGEIVNGPFAQIVRYEGQRMDSFLGSAIYDFYKICLQDHAILEAMRHDRGIKLFPFSLYILTHELIHVVRFSKFLCNFAATDNERMAEETIVHQETHDMLSRLTLDGLPEVFRFYNKWRLPMEQVSDS
ncbi:MAG: hypothetical protein RBT11_15835 [Desulfobacterales bacterium]|jgi:hypothetical protein|nr:hypothetical protein [Desulfobacterales bacterium]